MSECELPQFFNWSEPVARKQHRCCECSAPIHKGEKHFSATGRWDYGIETYRQHLLCCEACMFVRDNLNGSECICFGGLREWHSEARYQYDRKEPHPVWREFRNKLAAIKRRERVSAK